MSPEEIAAAIEREERPAQVRLRHGPGEEDWDRITVHGLFDSPRGLLVEGRPYRSRHLKLWPLKRYIDVRIGWDKP